MSIACLTESGSVSRQAVTKHLHALEEAGLVTRSRTNGISRSIGFARWRSRTEVLTRRHRQPSFLLNQPSEEADADGHVQPVPFRSAGANLKNDERKENDAGAGH